MANDSKIPQKIALQGIAFYRYFISPWFGNCCRFYPSCSLYAHSAFKQYGVIKGGYLTLKRIAKCHPFHPGGVDVLP
jgi:uncharacterized protein